MKRIEFIRLAALASTTGLLGSFNYLSSAKKGKKVIVIGAGMAGIAAAKMLQKNGFDVIVLEGQNRLGGRIRSEEFEGSTIDFGASWIHGSIGNPITQLAKEYNIQTKDTDYDNVQLWNSKGQQLSEDYKNDIFKETDWIYAKAVRYSNRQDKDVSMEESILAVLKEEESLSDEEKMALNWRTTTLEMNAGCDFSQMSTWYGSNKGFGGMDKLFPGGYRQLIDKMAEGLIVQLQTTVTEIHYQRDQVIVSSDNKKWEADYCICTVPLGVLKKNNIKFSPPLPKEKQAAIDEKLNMGVLNKIAFKFPKVFWPNTNHFIGHLSDKKGDFPIFLNWAYYTKQPILLGFHVGDYAKELEKLSDEEIMNRGNKLFSKLFKDALPIEAVARSKWSEHPFAYGSYSYIPVGAGDDGSNLLAKPIFRLLFAGEATFSKYPGTVHGAYLSGLREAERIIG